MRNAKKHVSVSHPFWLSMTFPDGRPEYLLHRFKVSWIKSKEPSCRRISQRGAAFGTFSVVFLSVLPQNSFGLVFRNMTAIRCAREKKMYVFYMALACMAKRHKGYFSWKHFLVAAKFMVNNFVTQTVARYYATAICIVQHIVYFFAICHSSRWITSHVERRFCRETKYDFLIPHCVNMRISWFDSGKATTNTF